MANKLSLRDFAQQQGYDVGYSQVPGVDGNNQPFNSGYVSLHNPQTGFTTGFTQGQGVGMGVGEFTGGTHYVTNQDQLMKMMQSNMPKTDVASGKAPYEYNRQHLTNDAINNSLGAINKQFNYDPTQDRALHSAQQQAQDTVKKYMARSGMLYADSTKAKMQSESQKLIPQYEDRAYGRFQDERQNQYNLLSQKAQLEQLNYQEYKDLQNMEMQLYGTVLNPEMRQHMATYNSIPNEMKRDLENTFGKDYHAEINRLRAQDPNHHMIPVLEAMRANKILKDPNLISKYGSQYGIATPALAERGVQYDTAEIQKGLAEIELKYADQIKSAEYQRIKQDLESGNYQNAILKIQAANFPREMDLKLRQMAADISHTQAQTSRIYSLT